VLPEDFPSVWYFEKQEFDSFSLEKKNMKKKKKVLKKKESWM